MDADQPRYLSADVAAGSANFGEESSLAGAAEALNADLVEAVRLISQGLEALAGIGAEAGFCSIGPEGLIAVARDVEALRTRLIPVDGYLHEAAEVEDLAAFTDTPSAAAALAQVVKIRPAEARARAARARAVLPRNGFSGGQVPPELPELAAAVAAGAVSTDQVDVIGAAMRRFATNPQVGVEALAWAEGTLVGHAAAFGPLELRKVAKKLDDGLLPDGDEPDDRIVQARRGVTIGARQRDGLYSISGFLTPSLKARLEAALDPLAKPRPAADGTRDGRSVAQRTHDALEDLVARELASDDLPGSGGTPATVHLNVDADRLLAALGITPTDSAAGDASDGDASDGDTSDGDTSSGSSDDASDGGSPQRGSQGGDSSGDSSRGVSEGVERGSAVVGTIAGGEPVTLADFQRLAGEALLIPTWATATGGILAYGRARRIASEGQTQALIARDGGCSHPGCEAPPGWCERHHVVEWWRGGNTDLDNLTLVCRFHHRQLDSSGWRIRMVDGLPWWTPPRHVDPGQRPLLNTRIRVPGQEEIDRVAAALRRAHTTQTADTPDGEGEGLDPADELMALLARHVADPHRRDQFHHELADLFTDYTDAHTAATTSVA